VIEHNRVTDQDAGASVAGLNTQSLLNESSITTSLLGLNGHTIKQYHYRASDKDGGIIEGVMHAQHLDELRQKLSAQQLWLIQAGDKNTTAKSITPGNTNKNLATLPSWLNKQQLFKASPLLSGQEQLLFTQQTASLLEAGLPLSEALESVAAQSGSEKIQARITQLRQSITEGSTLSQALSKSIIDNSRTLTTEFPEEYRAMVAAGEKTGSLDNVLSNLASQLEQSRQLKHRLVVAMTYPAIVTTIAILVVIALLTYVVPQVIQVFQNSHQKLPLLTRSLIVLSQGIKQYGWFVLLGLITLSIIVWRQWQRPSFQMACHQVLLRLPVVGPLVRQLSSAQLAGSLAMLLQGGVPLLQALHTSQKTIFSKPIQQSLQAISQQVQQGSALAKSLQLNGQFPPLLIRMTQTGEQTGKLSLMLQRCAGLLRGEAERKIIILTSLLEPLLVLGMGLMVLLIVLAVLMPIIEINQLIR
jgi:general secretion pathway protein F